LSGAKDIEDFENIEIFLREQIEFLSPKSRDETKDTISEIIYSNDRGIYYIYGEKGVGKSRFIGEIIKEVKDDIFYISTAPKDEREFLEEIYMQLRGKRFSQNVKIDEVRIRVNDAFKKINHTIIIDNVADENVPLLKEIENSIKLLDGLKMVLILDKNLTEQSSINLEIKGKIEIKKISKDEVSEFIKLAFQDNGFEKERVALLKSIDFINETTDGNFNKFIDLISNAFKIVSFSNKEGIDKFQDLNECILIMSAFDKELING
jgi:adenosyl cobinamide kinase/adenosyl cobinamide phosphate guanylyltransferase